MPHLFEPAPTARSKCRGCGERIAAGALRFGESLPNPFAEGETTYWFHPECAAFKRPEPFLEGLGSLAEPPEEVARLEAEARLTVEHPRLARVDGAELDPSGRARCRSCRAAIAKGAWRVRLVFYEEGRFSPGGFVHATCARAYFETADLLPRLRRFSPLLDEGSLSAVAAELGSGP